MILMLTNSKHYIIIEYNIIVFLLFHEIRV